jgi:LuxR family transcriptional regulator, quorum-sensing system regulator BjaR1
MAAGMLDISRAAFDFVDDIERLSDQRLLMDRFGRELGGYGYHAWIIANLPNPGGRTDSLALLSGWPQGWTNLYRRLKLIHNDPVVAHCLRSTAPFEWREAPCDPLANPKAQEVMDRAGDFGMNRGFCVPIHSSDGHEAVVTMAGERAELGGQVRPALHLMALYVYAKAVDLCLPKRFPAAPALLTRREREVLQWTAAGKTSWKISQILGVAESTITAHLKAAAAKYAAPNRVATVVVALRRGEISL